MEHSRGRLFGLFLRKRLQFLAIAIPVRILPHRVLKALAGLLEEDLVTDPDRSHVAWWVCSHWCQAVWETGFEAEGFGQTTFDILNSLKPSEITLPWKCPQIVPS